jgi:hypothetical protein
MILSETHLYLFIGLCFALTIVGVLIGRSTKTAQRQTSIADIGEDALQNIAKILWAKDITAREFADKCAKIRDEAWDGKELLERLVTLKNKKQ